MINVKLDNKAKNTVAKTLDLGGDSDSSMIEVPAHSRLTLDGNKLLQLLIAKGVDVDAEVLIADESSPYTGILLGGTLSLGSFLYHNIDPHILYPYYYYNSNDIYISWRVDEFTSEIKEIGERTEALTYRTMLQALDTLTIGNISGRKLIPYVAIKTSSQSDATPVDITTDEFLSFITITPLPALEE